jgi:hypothetical protein
MKAIHLRYNTRNALITDVQRAFPSWDGDKNDLPDWLDNHGFIKGRVRDINGNVLGFDIYLLVADDFIVPNWVQGTVLIGRDNHQFAGYPIDNSLNEIIQ